MWPAHCTLHPDRAEEVEPMWEGSPHDCLPCIQLIGDEVSVWCVCGVCVWCVCVVCVCVCGVSVCVWCVCVCVV